MTPSQFSTTFALAGACLCLSACSFNKVFFQPDKIDPKAKRYTITYAGNNDTLEIPFSGAAHQPYFIKNHKDTVDLGYTIESVIFKSTDGNNLNGWLLKPKNTVPGITIVHLHGNAGNLFSQRALIDPLVKKGFQVFMFDYSGYGFSEGNPTKASTLADALSAIDYVKSRNDVRNTRLVIYGQSLGGHLSAVAAEQRQSVTDALVIEGAFSSRKDIAAMMLRRMHLPGFLGRALVNQTYAAKKSIRKYHKPLLVVHSSEDEVASIKMGRTIFKNANEPKSFYEIKGPHIRGAVLYTDSIAAKIKMMVP